METKKADDTMCPKCNVAMVNGVCPKCGMKAEDVKSKDSSSNQGNKA